MKKILAITFMTVSAACLCDHPLSQEMSVYFEHVKSEFLRLEKKNSIKKLEKQKENLNLYTVVNTIANRDVEALKKMSSEQLIFELGDIWIPGKKIKGILGEKIQQVVIGGENAIFFVLLHSTTNKTEKENKKTLEMLAILLEKNLSLDAKSGIAYFVGGKDYLALYSLAEAALLFSFPEALEVVLKHGALFYKHNTTTIIDKMKKNNNPNLKKFQTLLHTYKSQQRVGHKFFSWF